MSWTCVSLDCGRLDLADIDIPCGIWPVLLWEVLDLHSQDLVPREDSSQLVELVVVSQRNIVFRVVRGSEVKRSHIKPFPVEIHWHWHSMFLRDDNFLRIPHVRLSWPLV